MSGEWPEVRLGDIVSNFDSQRVPLSAREREKRRGRYPYYGATGVIDYVDDYLFEGLHLLVAEDGSVETDHGRPFLQLVDGRFWVNNHAHVLKGETDIDTRYLFYALSTIQIRPFMTGSVQAKLSQANLNRIPIPYPERGTRHTIAAILGAMDDKIELNRQMNETLESIARAIFKSWFVNFDPVRAKAEGRDPGLPKEIADLFPSRFEDSEPGEIPTGWRWETVGQHMVNFDSKRIPVSQAERARRQGPYPYYGASSVMDHINDYLFDGIYLLVGEDGSVTQEDGLAITQYVWGKIWVNNHAHVIQGKGAVSTEQLYLYFHFRPISPYVTGAVQPKLSQGRMNDIPFLFPDDSVCRAFAEVVSTYFARLRANTDETKTLSTLRDALLPRLTSGELRVKDAERFFRERI